MMGPVRVLIVDDSVVVRRLLSEILSAEPGLEVAGVAGTGSTALAKVDLLRPDIITLDVELPDMSGLDVLAEIRKRAPKLPVIMFSSLTQRAAATTVEALALGATDCVAKPSGDGGREAATEQVRRELVTKVRALAEAIRPSAPSPRHSHIPCAPVANRRIEILAVGASTGGPNALATLFQHIPATLRVPVVIVQHMPPLFTRMLAERLAGTCPLPFREAADGDVLEPGTAWIAPGDFHMTLVRQRGKVIVALTQAPPENSCRPAVDVLFRSVAEVYGSATLATVLTGMGQDGFRGIEVLAGKGAQVVVQDEASSVVWGMPGIVARSGLAQAVLPLPRMADELMRRIDAPDGFARARNDEVRNAH
jgi:two-component system chemotaxis response regulator CheB